MSEGIKLKCPKCGCFQFPLWDTCNIYMDMLMVHIQIYFQFPLWDTLNILITIILIVIICFQFPLWDTGMI